MKRSIKQKLTKALTAAFIATAVVGTVFAIGFLKDNREDTPFKGVYGDTLTAFADVEDPIEPAIQVENFILKKMISVDKKYMLLATSISDITAYREIGYEITVDGETESIADKTFYTGIQVRTDNDGGKYVFHMQDIYGTEYSYENAGMLVYEIPYMETAEYVVTPYFVQNDGNIVEGTSGHLASAYVKNGGFETGDLTGWTILTDGMSDGVISSEYYWVENLPYNQEGWYHLDGWNTGIAESGSWAVRSTTFRLCGCGYISAKMGGNAAALKVYKADGTPVGEFKANSFSNTNYPFVGDGEGKGSWADMRTYYMDLSEFIGEELYIELHDMGSGVWALAFFDDIVSYYETVPDIVNGYDTVTAPVSIGDDGYIYGEVKLKWILLENSYLVS
ncbi:MAG: hypothetical protein ACI4MC_01215 [Candidatus Coproplasma sp.]